MSDPSPVDRFKPDMPAIPGVSPEHRPQSSAKNTAPYLVVGALVVLVVLLFFAGRWFFHPKTVNAPTADATPQIDVPPPAPDPSASFPHVTDSSPEITSVSALAKPWSSQQFFFKNSVTGANIPAMIIRLPEGSAGQSTGYWAFQLKAPFGDCQLEYISDLQKLKTDYDFRAAKHPMVGNPCTRTLFDPLRMASLPGSVWVRGAMVQGSDLRPPLGIEVQIKDGSILALRLE